MLAANDTTPNTALPKPSHKGMVSPTAPSVFASVDFQGYRFGRRAPFLFSVLTDNGDNVTCGYADVTRDAAVEMAVYILTAAAGLEGLSDSEREKLRSIADMQLAV